VSFHLLDADHGKGAGNQSVSGVTRAGLCPAFVGKLLVEVEA
jgi:hypothetical protein